MSRDFIGDIHGHASAMHGLLEKLGYENRNGAYRHSDPNRTVVFLGDYIDRGPEQLEVLNTVRRMMDAGTAVGIMGNHEYNAIGYATLAPGSKSQHLRLRGSRNKYQHLKFIEAVGLDSPLHYEWVNWMRTLPIFIEDENFNAVHACWHRNHINFMKNFANQDGTFNQEILESGFIKTSDIYVHVEALLKGLEIDLPEGYSFFDKQGIERTRSRTRWWDSEAINYRDAVVQEKGLENLPELMLPENVMPVTLNKSTFFGHYWMSGEPFLLSDKIACLDFSVAKDGVLTSYHLDGEDVLCNNKLSWINSHGHRDTFTRKENSQILTPYTESEKQLIMR